MFLGKDFFGSLVMAISGQRVCERVNTKHSNAQMRQVARWQVASWQAGKLARWQEVVDMFHLFGSCSAMCSLHATAIADPATRWSATAPAPTPARSPFLCLCPLPCPSRSIVKVIKNLATVLPHYKKQIKIVFFIFCIFYCVSQQLFGACCMPSSSKG